MDFLRLVNIFVILYFITELSVDTYLMTESGKIIPEGYQLQFNFTGTHNCPIGGCYYRAQVNMTMKIIGRADVIKLVTDNLTKIEHSATR